MAIIESSKVSGVSTVTSTDSAVYKEHADNYIAANAYPSVSGNSGTYLFTDGSTQSWQQQKPTGFIEYRTGGSYTYTIPTTASKFYIEAISAGGGGSTALVGNPGTPGSGGGAGAYASWIIPRQELGSATTMLVGVGTGGVGGNCMGVCGSTDSIVWIPRVHPSILSGGTPYTRSSFLNSVHLIHGGSSAYATSTDSVTWTARTLGTFINANASTFGNSTYVMGGDSGVILTSTNSVEWTSRTAGYTGGSILTLIFASTLNQFLYGGSTSGTFATSTDAISWTLRTGPPSFASSLENGAFGNGRYFVGYNGYGTAGSTDGINWVYRTAADTNNLYNVSAITYGNNLWILAGIPPGSNSTRPIYSSTDSITWTIRTTGSQTFAANSYTNSNVGQPTRGGFASVLNTFILAGSTNTIVTSTDTINWNVRTCLFKRGYNISDVYGFSGGYLAVGTIGSNGADGQRTTISWTTGSESTRLSTSGGSTNGGRGAIGSSGGSNSNGNSGFDYNILYSVNGTTGGSGITLPAAFTAVTQTSPYQATGGGAGALNTGIGQSSITFLYNNLYGSGGSTSGGNGDSGIPDSYGVSYGSGGSGGGALTRGITAWYMRTSGLVGTTSADVIFATSTYVIGNSNGQISTSTDTVSWTLRTLSTNLNVISFAFGSTPTNTFVASGALQLLNTSTDAINWTIRTAGFAASANINDVIYTGTTPLYISGGDFRVLNTSTDAINWTLRTTNFGATGLPTISAIAYASGISEKFAITGTVRALSTSTNAIEWTVRTLGTASATMSAMASNNSIYVSGGAGNRIFTSTNGIQWTARTSGLGGTATISRIRFKNNYFIAGSNADRSFRVSTDAITWESSLYNRAGTTLNGIDFNSSTYIGMCIDGTVVCGETTVQSVAGNGGNGTKGGGGGGGGYSNVVRVPSFGVGGDGGDGYVRITWW